MRRRPYSNDGAATWTDQETGEVVPLPTYYPLTPWNPADSWDAQDLRIAANREGWTHRLEFARRSSSLNRWRMKPPAFAAEVDVMRRQEVGIQTAENERWYENLGAAGELAWNPTFSGSAVMPKAHIEAYVNGEAPRMQCPSPPIHERWGVSGDTGFAEAAVIPLLFDPGEQTGEGIGSHGGGQDTVCILPRWMMFSRTDFNVESEANVHRHFWASYSPVTLSGTRGLVNSPWHGATSGISWVDGFHKGYFYDPARQLVTDVDPALFAALGFTFANVDLIEVGVALNVPELYAAYNGTREVLGASPILPGTGYAGSIMEAETFDGESPGLCIGFMARLYPLAAGGRFPTELTFGHHRNPAHPPPNLDQSNGQFMFMHSLSLREDRRRGWIGQVRWIITAQTVEEVTAKMDRLYREDVLDRPLPWHLIPPHVLARGRYRPDY